MKGSSRFQFDDDSVTGINVTPLVDVCLVLVIIFMVATPLLSRPAFEVSLPVAKTKEGEEQDKVTLSLSADGRLAVDSAEYLSVDEAQTALKRAIANTESGLVVIRADREALHGRLTDLMARAKAAGAKSLTVATEQKR
ncbi:MAG: biopolymer transporter ExbD [Elusimicrobia bacterium]|nr:biopolymer transporter ExbD [Elusimicrobiota bacterium]